MAGDMGPGEIEAFLRTWVRPRAAAIDRDVSALREALDEMGRRGLLGLRVPAEFGGTGLEAAAFRRFQEASARASGALAFLESQHQSACGLVARSPNAALKARLLPRFARGEVRSGIAFSHLRRAGPPALAATPVPAGYRLEGTLSWVTGWGLFETCVTAGSLPDGRTIFVTHDLAESATLRASPPLSLAAMEVTQTVSLEARGLFVPEGDVVDVHSGSWIRENDRLAIALQSPLALGCAQAGIDGVREESEKRGNPGMAGAAARLEAELGECRAAAYRAMEEKEDVEKGLKARAWAIELAGRAAHAAVLAAAGQGNVVPHAAQRVWREALAFSVLALTPPIQGAALDRLAALGGSARGS
jgi:alkylation response protein AidB-like acyl-CoA dehydrogenase